MYSIQYASEVIVREKGEALFLCCQDCDSLVVVVVAYFDLHLAGRHLAAIGRADDCFSRF